MKSIIRMTPQTNIVLSTARRLGHASNSQILIEAHKTMPDLSATTVHRITNRLIDGGILAKGPEINGTQLVDANVTAHDHFMCSACSGIKDLRINNDLRTAIKREVGIKILPKSLIIYGDCANCPKAIDS